MRIARVACCSTVYHSQNVVQTFGNFFCISYKFISVRKERWCIHQNWEHAWVRQSSASFATVKLCNPICEHISKKSWTFHYFSLLIVYYKNWEKTKIRMRRRIYTKFIRFANSQFILIKRVYAANKKFMLVLDLTRLVLCLCHCCPHIRPQTGMSSSPHPHIIIWQWKPTTRNPAKVVPLSGVPQTFKMLKTGQIGRILTS